MEVKLLLMVNNACWLTCVYAHIVKTKLLFQQILWYYNHDYPSYANSKDVVLVKHLWEAIKVYFQVPASITAFIKFA